MSAYKKLLEKVQEIHDLQKASAVLGWDREVNMPEAGNEIRSKQLATLNRIAHAAFTSAEMGELIEAADADAAGIDYDSDEASLIRFLRHKYDEEKNLPAEFVAYRTEITSQAEMVWRKAREDNDFAIFQPWLAQIVGLCQEMAELYGYDDEKYDALLDKYERGAKTAEVAEVFKSAAKALVPLRQAIDEKGLNIDDSFLYQSFDLDRQKEFASYIARAVGYDLSRGHLGTSTHPFSTSFSRDDARITNRYQPNYLGPSVFGALHEAGHAIYEQGTHPSLSRTPLARGASSGIHESQSRLFENIIGRSYPFWVKHYAKLQATFPGQLDNVSVRQFYLAVNRVRPSLIRVEADELTYNLHIVLRFELEQAMIVGDLLPADLPAAWNDGMRDLLGIVPPNDREGCLQDIHWSGTIFGYFPTYALGNLYGAAFYDAALTQEPDIASDLALGNTGLLLSWLRENIHQHGRKFTPKEIVTRATGRPLSHHAFVRYAWEKFGDVYGL
jgi:carboxypeptidase Taq